MAMRLRINPDKCIYAKYGSNYHSHIQQISPCQYDAKVANLLGNDLVFQGVETKQIRLLHVIKALRTLVHCLLCQSHKEWHHEHAQQAENKDCQNCQEVPE